MAIPKLTKQNIIDALKYIDEHGTPVHYQSVKYDLISENGTRYSPKYVVAVAAHLADGSDISTEAFNSISAKSLLESQGFTIGAKDQEKYELCITADRVESTDERFTMDDLSLGDNYRPLGTFFEKADGTIIRRKYSKGEKRTSNQTLPRLACQIFEKQISELTVDDKENFPICKHRLNEEMIKGIYSSVSEIQAKRNTTSWEYSTYTCNNGQQFVFYSWNIFSTIYFVQECLKRFGEPGDRFILTYLEKDKKEDPPVDPPSPSITVPIETPQPPNGYKNHFSSMLLESKNMIFRGAPGTGKSYLTKKIAADIVSNGYTDDYTLLTEEQKKQVEFVQFHPSYDYSDFVEGLRPRVNDDGTMGFELQDGIFKRFVARARKNFEDSQKTKETIQNEMSVQESITDFFSSIEMGVDVFKIISGNEFTITSVDDRHVYISIPGNALVNKLTLNLDEIRQLLESKRKFEKRKDVTEFFGKTFGTQAHSYDLAIYKEIMKRKKKLSASNAKATERKNYVFIIDEINRGEISKIFGELFFAIDPGYRGRAGEISTQYANLHSDPDEKFYIPENVFIIGTMNDIDRSVDSFDFAMRRRFRFVELKADQQLEMLSLLENEDKKAEAIRRMTALNREIASVEDLNENYQIGASYFLKLKTLSFNFDELWTDYLQPLLQEYIQGMYDEEGIMSRFAKAYGYRKVPEGDMDEAAQN